MDRGWAIASLFGIPIIVAPSWVLVMGVITYAYGQAWLGMDWGETTAWIAAIAMTLLLFVSVVLHELGHSLMARSHRIPVSSIRLFLFGGVATISEESRTPGQAIQVAIAGPAVSFGLFLIFGLMELLLPERSPGSTIAANLAGLNLVMALFNLIPGLPLDGGQVLKAVIWKLSGNRIRGVRWAARVGWLLGGGAIALSLVLAVQLGMFNLLWLAFIGWFGMRQASAHQQFVALQAILLRLTAADAMTPVDQTPPQPSPPAIARPSEPAAVSDRDCLADLIPHLETLQQPWVQVLASDGTIVGTLDRGDMVRAIAQALKQPIADPIVQRIKAEQRYPDSLPLVAIAQTARIR